MLYGLNHTLNYDFSLKLTENIRKNIFAMASNQMFSYGYQPVFLDIISNIK